MTDIGLTREKNEDRYRTEITQDGVLLVVCDGMGGHAGGETASEIAVNSIVSFWQSARYGHTRQALDECLRYANSQILEYAGQNPQLSGMGTTACICLIKNNGETWYAHIGDSRIYHYKSSQDKLLRLTKDHSMVQGMVDNGLISQEEAEHHPDRNRILKTLGVQEDVNPEVCTQPLMLEKNDIILLCSDGLSGMVDDHHIQQILKNESELSKKGMDLIDMAKKNGGDDNITLQLFRWSEDSNIKSEGAKFKEEKGWSGRALRSIGSLF